MIFLPKPEVLILFRSNKYFSKKPIVQLAVVPEYSILVALTDNIISVHDIDLAVMNFPLISQVRIFIIIDYIGWITTHEVKHGF